MRFIDSRLIMIFLLLVCLAVGCKQAPDEIETTPTSSKEDIANEAYAVLLREEETRIVHYDFNTITVLNQTPALYGLFEASFDLSTTITNGDQFNTNIVHINGYFTSPSGNTTIMPAFYKQNHGDKWAIRYSPLEVGLYTFYLKDELHGTTTQELTFETIEPTSGTRGFIRTDGNKLVDSYDNQFTLFGTNYAWGTLKEYETALPLYKEHGMNFIRFWSQCDWSTFNLESKAGEDHEGGESMVYQGLGNYNLDNANRFDTLISLFEENDVYMQFCLFNLWDFDSGHWADNAYNRDNGGPCYWKENDTDFWTHPIALKYQKQLIHYIYARWGYSKNLAVFEYWNECDNKVGTKKRSTRDQWHKVMDDYFKSLDIYNRPTTTSYAWKDHLSFNNNNTKNDPWQSQGFLDIADPHSYLPVDKDPVETWINEINFTAAQHPGDKPVYIGEFSENNSETQYVSSSKERYFAEGIWAPFFFADTAGSNLHWRIDSKFMPTDTMLDYMLYAVNFIQPFENRLSDMTFHYSGSVNDIRMGYYADSSALLMYVRDDQTNHTMDNGRIISNISYTIEGFEAGPYLVIYYNPFTGKVIHTTEESVNNDKLTLTLPNFTRNLAVSVQLKASMDVISE